jgi:uncharacterized integral membrane protein
LVATVEMPLIIALVIAALLGLLLGWMVPRLRRDRPCAPVCAWWPPAG